MIRVRDLESSREQVLALRDRASDSDPSFYERGVLSLRFTEDGRLLSSGYGGVRRWDLETGVSEWLAKVRDDKLVTMDASRDGPASGG